MIGRFVEAGGRVAVEHRAAESHVIDAVAIDAHRHVPAGHHHFELAFIGIAEHGDALRFAVALAIVFQLPIDLRNPIGLEQPFVDRADHVLLIFGVKIAGDHFVGDVPVVAHVRAQQAALRVDMIPIECHGFLLFRLQRIVKLLDQRFGSGLCRAGAGGCFSGFRAADQHIRQAHRAGGQCRGAGGFHKIAPAEKIAKREKLEARFAIGARFVFR